MNSLEHDELNKQGRSLIGKMIVHPRFGSGKVTEYDSDNPCITVQFEDKSRVLVFNDRTRELLNLISEDEKRRKNRILNSSGKTYLTDWEEDEMADSLLAHLYTRIQGSQEDVATVSLNYIIDSSPELNKAFNKLLSDSLKIDIDPDIRYRDQSIGENMERPDMSGTNSDGKEVVLCEMKFYAGLTDNQPNGYLDRLIKEDGKALVFVCPKARQMSLWSKVKDLCVEKGRTLKDEDGYRVTVDGIAMAIVTWSQIIECLRLTASSVAVTALPDIAQLAGFCNMMDQDAFIPFTPEELGSETARKEDRYANIVDAVTDKLDNMKELEPCKKSKQNAWREGYWRYINIKGHRIDIYYHRPAWKASIAETPLWVSIFDEEGNQSETYKKHFDTYQDNKRFNHYTGRRMLALNIKPYVPQEDIVDDLVSQILAYIDDLDGALS